jgi:6-phosphogluconate dehydrogenase
MEQANEIGFIGLGRMGANMVIRMLRTRKLRVVVWDRSPEPREKAVKLGAIGSESIKEFVGKLEQKPKVVWLMLPSGEVTENAFQELLGLLDEGDILVDGANSNFHDTTRRHEEAKKKGINMLDIGISGGVVAAERGYAMMAGGRKEDYDFIKPILDSFGYPEGYGLVGPGGVGHYVKMIHNAIEYGMMQAIAEGFDLLKNGRVKDLDVQRISGIWNHGTIISSFLLEMVGNALKKSADLDYLKPHVEDSGEGRWAAIEAMEHSVPFVVNSYALQARYLSRDKDSYAFKLLSAMRNEFGGHAIKK